MNFCSIRAVHEREIDHTRCSSFHGCYQISFQTSKKRLIQKVEYPFESAKFSGFDSFTSENFKVIHTDPARGFTSPPPHHKTPKIKKSACGASKILNFSQLWHILESKASPKIFISFLFVWEVVLKTYGCP